MKLPAYPKYKPSGIEWLGDVPEHWEVKPLGFLVTKIGSGKTPRGGAENYQSEGIMLIRSQNVYDDGLRLDDVVFIDEDTDDEMAWSRVSSLDVLLNITGASLGRCTVAPKEFPKANVNQHVCIIRPDTRKLDPLFTQFSLISQSVKNQIFADEAGSSREGLNFQQVRDLIVLIPPLPEQVAIASSLTRQTALIDRLMEKRRELIERLKEKRTALISHTVTRGLPPKAATKAGLPVNPPLKPSGVEWLGYIPAHWDVKRFRRLITHFDQGSSPNANNYPAPVDELAVLKLGAASKGIFRPEENKALDELPEGLVPLTPSEGDLLISRANTPSLVGDVCVVDKDYPKLLIPDLIYRLRVNEATSAKFVCWFLLSSFGRARIESDARGSNGSMVKLGQGHVRAWTIPIPPPHEQNVIAEYLSEETAKVDSLVAKVEKAVERLQEYRIALITAAVTGKIDVRNISERV